MLTDSVGYAVSAIENLENKDMNKFSAYQSIDDNFKDSSENYTLVFD